MIKFILIPALVMLSCGSTKTNTTALKVDSAMVAEKEIKDEQGVMYQRDSAILPEPIDAAVPNCIKNKIDSFKLKEAHEKPQRVIEYVYKGKKVYYVVMPCCDFFNEVYDDKCNFLGAPDGGFTGKGDGKLPDFFAEAKNEKLIWGTPK
jgi:hypothetical protein